jgi:hypothetical protein
MLVNMLSRCTFYVREAMEFWDHTPLHILPVKGCQYLVQMTGEQTKRLFLFKNSDKEFQSAMAVGTEKGLSACSISQGRGSTSTGSWKDSSGGSSAWPGTVIGST